MSDLERGLRDLLTDSNLHVPVRADALRIVNEGVRRRRRRRTIAVSTAAAAAVGVVVAAALTVPAALTADGSHHPSPAQPDGRFDVAWVDKPAPKPWSPQPVQPKPPTMDAPRCTADQLRTGTPISNGATGMLFTTIPLRNVSTTPCLLVGRPPSVVAQSPGQPDVAATRGLHLGNGGVGGDLAPGKRGYLTVETDRDCPARYADPNNTFPTKRYASLSVTLPSGTSFSLPVGLDVECGLRTGGLGVDVPQPTTPRDPRRGLAAAIDVPDRAVVGQTFTYVVILSNITSSPISLRHCPGYTEWINDGEAREVKASYGLNCSTVHLIAPGQQVRYQMRLDLPGDVDLGPADINWTMQFAGARDGAAPVTVSAG